MPDENKFSKLREIGYTIPVTCDLCDHGEFSTSGGWGTCGLHLYGHLKHTGPVRGVSIHRTGTCPSRKLSPIKLYSAGYGAHVEFVDAQNSDAKRPG